MLHWMQPIQNPSMHFYFFIQVSVLISDNFTPPITPSTILFPILSASHCLEEVVPRKEISVSTYMTVFKKIRKMQTGKCPLASTLEAVPIPEIRIGNALNLRGCFSCFPAIPMIVILPSFSFILYIFYCQLYHTEKHRKHYVPYGSRLANLAICQMP